MHRGSTGGGGRVGRAGGAAAPGGLFGAPCTPSRPKLRFGNNASRINGRSWQLGAYGAFGAGGLFGQAYAGFGRDKHRISRAGIIDDMRARPDGSHVTAGAKVGYL